MPNRNILTAFLAAAAIAWPSALSALGTAGKDGRPDPAGPLAGHADDAPAVPAKGAPPKIAIVIDDFGLTYKKNVPDDDWMKLKWPMTFAVMPQSPRTKKAAEDTLKNGKELIIHFPFDPFLSLALPQDQASPEDEAKVSGLLDDALKSIPHAVGLNNHRSLKGTANAPLMRWFMGRIKPLGIYFVDSHVGPKSVAYKEAKAAGIKTAVNQIFLEDGPHHDKDFCERMLRVGAQAAKKKGGAIVIGHHYFHGTFDCLVEMVPKLQQEGYQFVFASEVVQ